MFAPTISTRRRAFMPRIATPLSIAIAVALSSTAMTAQAAPAKSDASDVESPQRIYERLQNPDSPIDESRLVSDEVVAQKTRLFFECTQVQTDAARLACFDKVSQQGETPSYTTSKQPLDLAKTIKTTFKGSPQVVLADDTTRTTNAAESRNVSLESVEDKDETQILKDIGVTKSEVEQYTPLSLAYDLDKNSERGTWSARPHRPMYLLPLFYSVDPNRDPSSPNQETVEYTSNDMRSTELKLQVSIKTKVAEDLFDTNADMWFGYTQQSHWQVYNEDNSRPFRATDYEPEIFITQPVKANLPFGGRLRMLGVGASHHSNGQSDPLSRSWNRLYVMGGAEWGKFAIVPRLWTRINTESNSDKDDNPDIEDFMGYGDVTFLYDLPNEQSLSGTLRYNTKTDKGAAQIDYIYPLSNNVNGYLQVFHGYGESIIDYNHENTAIGVGVMLNDWKGL